MFCHGEQHVYQDQQSLAECQAKQMKEGTFFQLQ